MPTAVTRDEDGDELGLEHAAQQDHLGQAEGDDGHHEREQGAHRQALGVEGVDQGQDARRRWSTAGPRSSTAIRTANGLSAPA